MKSSEYSHFTPRHLRNKILPYDESSENLDIEEVHPTDSKLIRNNRDSEESEPKEIAFRIDEEDSKQYGVISIGSNSLFKSTNRRENTRYSNKFANNLQRRADSHNWFDDNSNFGKRVNNEPQNKNSEDAKEEIKGVSVSNSQIKDEESIDFSGHNESIGIDTKIDLETKQRNIKRHITILCK